MLLCFLSQPAFSTGPNLQGPGGRPGLRLCSPITRLLERVKYLAAKVFLLLEAVGSITKLAICANFFYILFIKSQPHPQADKLIPVFQ